MKKNTSRNMGLPPKHISIIIILCIISMAMVLLAARQSPHYQSHTAIPSITPSQPLIGENINQKPEDETHMTDGIILIGALLMGVIIFGTLYATRDHKKKPPLR